MITVLAPGRINIIGEHTDHQGGYVLPSTITKGIKIQVEETNADSIAVYSQEMDEQVALDPTILRSTGHWSDYIAGSIAQFIRRTDIIPRVDIKISSSLPHGAGLSSSAALQVGTIYALAKLYDVSIDCKELARMAWLSETQFVGVKCGIMDQIVIACSKTANPILLDCSTLKIDQITIPSAVGFLLLNTGVSRKLSDSKYNQRIAELEKAKQKLQYKGIRVNNLAHLPADELTRLRKSIGTEVSWMKRLVHVVEENRRVVKYHRLMNKKSIIEAGELLFQSHKSLKDYFNASWKEADILVNSGKSISEIHGMRMVGAGWGGNLLIQSFLSDQDKIIDFFYERFDWISPKNIQKIQLASGVGIIS